MEQTDRRYDVDWLRVIAIGFLLLYHISIAFQPWGVFIGFIQNSHSLEAIWVPMVMLNIWRIPLLFFVSGMGVSFASRKRNWKQLMVERSRRILVPFLFGAVCIVPLHVILWQRFYNQNVVYKPEPGHLWFLANIFLYVVILLRAMKDQVFHGILCLVLPPYALYYLFAVSDEFLLRAAVVPHEGAGDLERTAQAHASQLERLCFGHVQPLE